MSELEHGREPENSKWILVDKPIDGMSTEEYMAWHQEYMKSVPEENIMMVSGQMLEINDDPEAFYNFVTVFQQLKRQGLQ